MLVEKIPEKELQLIDWYRNEYINNEVYTYRKKAIDYILREWDKQKSIFLYELLGKKFIVKKQINFQRTNEELYDSFQEYDSKYGYPYNLFKNKLRKVLSEDDYYSIRDFLEINLIIKNEIPSGEEIVLNLPGREKPYKIKSKMKIMKVLNAIAKAYNLTEEYEKLRIVQSLALNQKNTKGNLCLSIHPLDFMTMSDNDSNWTSCMQWRCENEEAGEYRQGTIEMMNSPTVLVAYLESETDMYLDDGSFWNNKKWRELFVVGPKMLIGVKGYPYCSDYLENETIKFIKELAKNNYNIIYAENYYTYSGSAIAVPGILGSKHIPFWFNTHHMYNDFGTTNNGHKLYLLDGIKPEELKDEDFIYSGVSECMWCGGRENEIEDSNIACSECLNGIKCSCCNYYYDENYITWVDDSAYCEDCLNEYTGVDSITEETHPVENMSQIYLSRYIDGDTEYSYRNRVIYIDIYDIGILKNYLVEDFVKKTETFYKELRVKTNWGNSRFDHYYLNWNDLNDDGKELFASVAKDFGVNLKEYFINDIAPID